MARKTAKDYRKEYSTLLNKVDALEARIKTRTIKMCKQHPDVIVGEITTAIEYADHFEEDGASIELHLHIMSKIEEDNEKQSGHVQTTMFPKS